MPSTQKAILKAGGDKRINNLDCLLDEKRILKKR